MNAANADKSARLLRVLGVLAEGGAVSTLELQQRAAVCCVSTCVAELRANGHKIKCESRGRRWYYSLERPAAPAAPVLA